MKELESGENNQISQFIGLFEDIEVSSRKHRLRRIVYNASNKISSVRNLHFLNKQFYFYYLKKYIKIIF